MWPKYYRNKNNNISFHNSERVTGEFASREYLNWRNTSFTVTRLEVLDQRNGFGGETYLEEGGLNYRAVSLNFSARLLGSVIDFIVNIYGDPVITNDVIQGEITNTSSLAQT